MQYRRAEPWPYSTCHVDGKAHHIFYSDRHKCPECGVPNPVQLGSTVTRASSLAPDVVRRIETPRPIDRYPRDIITSTTAAIDRNLEPAKPYFQSIGLTARARQPASSSASQPTESQTSAFQVQQIAEGVRQSGFVSRQTTASSHAGAVALGTTGSSSQAVTYSRIATQKNLKKTAADATKAYEKVHRVAVTVFILGAWLVPKKDLDGSDLSQYFYSTEEKHVERRGGWNTSVSDQSYAAIQPLNTDTRIPFIDYLLDDSGNSGRSFCTTRVITNLPNYRSHFFFDDWDQYSGQPKMINQSATSTNLPMARLLEAFTRKDRKPNILIGVTIQLEGEAPASLAASAFGSIAFTAPKRQRKLGTPAPAHNRATPIPSTEDVPEDVPADDSTPALARSPSPRCSITMGTPVKAEKPSWTSYTRDPSDQQPVVFCDLTKATPKLSKGKAPIIPAAPSQTSRQQSPSAPIPEPLSPEIDFGDYLHDFGTSPPKPRDSVVQSTESPSNGPWKKRSRPNTASAANSQCNQQDSQKELHGLDDSNGGTSMQQINTADKPIEKAVNQGLSPMMTRGRKRKRPN